MLHKIENDDNVDADEQSMKIKIGQIRVHCTKKKKNVGVCIFAVYT